MYKLYYAPGTCSMAIHVLLNEIGAPVQLEKVNLQEARTPEFLAVNPRGQVPVLVDDGQPIREGAAIILHLCEKHKSPLLPASGKERTTALEWLMFCNASLHPAYGRFFFTNRNAPEPAKDQLLTTAIAGINKLWQEVEQRLEKSPYLCGEQVTAADILLTVIANWGGMMPKKPEIGPKAKALFKKIIERPAYKKALETEQVEYKAAA